MDPLEDNFDRHKMVNLFAFLIESLSLYAQTLVGKSNLYFRRFLENFQIIELFDAVSDKLAEHPALRFVVFATALSCTIPVLMFILFGITSVVVTFAGFLFIEGTLLAIGGLCMFVCMATMILVFSVLAVTLGIFYVLTLKLGDILNKFETTSTLLRNIAPPITVNHPNEVSDRIVNAHQD